MITDAGFEISIFLKISIVLVFCIIDYMYVGWFLKKEAFLYYDILAMPTVYRFRATQQ